MRKAAEEAEKKVNKEQAKDAKAELETECQQLHQI
jgi:hypothetical protein